MKPFASARRALGVGLWLPFLGGCYASNVVAPQDRAVLAAPAELPWQPATSAAVDGLFESVSIEGDVAGSLLRVWYWFGRDGRYAGAALVDNGEGPAFQTLNGLWQLDAQGFALDGAAATLESAPDHLRLRTPQGALILRRARSS
jgi:hypothetical protein